MAFRCNISARRRGLEKVGKFATKITGYQPKKDSIVMSNTKIPGLSFSLKRALGITALKRQFTKATGIPTTKAGIERKVGEAIISKIFGKK